MKESKYHILLRIRPTIKLGSRYVDPIAEHNAVLKKEGNVAFAKFGNPFRKINCRRVSEAVAKGHTPFLYVAYKKGADYVGFKAPIARIVNYGRPSSFLQPSYYKELGLVATYWIILSSPLVPCGIEKLWVFSSGRPVMQSLKDSRCSIMTVVNRKPKVIV